MERIGKSLACAVVATALGVGCGGGGNSVDLPPGSGGAGGGGPVQVTTGDYQPLVVNATWAFNINDKGVKYDKTVTTEAFEDLGGMKAGTMAYRMRTTIPNDIQLTWYHREGDVVVRDHEQDFDGTMAMKTEDWYDPYRLRVDETADHLKAGASWNWSFTDIHSSRTKATASTAVTESWKVDAVDQPVTVPAGTFAALRLTHVDPTDMSTKTYWFVRGVGKVREETSGGHIEEMTSYQIPSQ
jgi:hypothetical protein